MGNEAFERDFAALVEGLPSRALIERMRRFRQHGRLTTLDHTTHVARTSLKWARALRLKVSERELVRGALLHDYFLYDWHEPGHTAHATQHPVFAERNAARDFDLTQKERNIISSHMWPLPPTRPPRSKEAWLVCVSDKWCSLAETLFMRR